MSATRPLTNWPFDGESRQYQPHDSYADIATLSSEPRSAPSTVDARPVPTNENAVSMNGVQSAMRDATSLDDDDEGTFVIHDAGLTLSESRSQTASTNPATPQPQMLRSTTSESDLIEVAQTGQQLPLDPSSKGKLKNRYVLADGTVVNGKGLGRGRPGMKRGPRKSGLSKETTESVGTLSTPSPSSQNRVSSSSKRKRTDSDVVRVEDDEESADDFSRESTPEYNPSASTQTRSGRQSQKPVQLVTATPATASPAAKKPSMLQSKSSPSVMRKHPKIKAKVYRGREIFALCEHCLRQHGPPGNVIVFCDACNKCWHQRCHDPKIANELVADAKAEWFCSHCDRILHGKKKSKAAGQQATSKPLAQLPSLSPARLVQAPPTSVPRYSLPLIPGMSLTLGQRKQYLNSLSKEKLIEIVLQAANLAPNMPIFETPLHLIPQPQPHGYAIFIDPPAHLFAQQPPSQTQPTPPSQTAEIASAMPPPPPPSQLPTHLHRQFATPASTPSSSSTSLSNTPMTASMPVVRDDRPIFTHPTAHVTSKPNTNPPPPNLAEDDEGYFDDFDEMALLYPKAGEGVYDTALPPESSDLGIMLEGESGATVFSHWVRGRNRADDMTGL